MREHPAFRLSFIWDRIAQTLGVHPLQSEDRTRIAEVPDELHCFLPESFNVDRFYAYRVSFADCGAFWSQEVVSGMKQLSLVEKNNLLTLRYENFFVDAKRQLDTFATFLGDEFFDEEWSASCAATVRAPNSTWRDLPEEEARTLTEACLPGFEALAAAGVRYAI